MLDENIDNNNVNAGDSYPDPALSQRDLFHRTDLLHEIVDISIDVDDHSYDNAGRAAVIDDDNSSTSSTSRNFTPEVAQKLQNLLHSLFMESGVYNCNNSSPKLERSKSMESHSPNVDNVVMPSEEDWEVVFTFKEARDRFLMELDKRRGKHAILNPSSFQSMAHAMKVF
jgi:hypothetical protein